MPRRSSSEGSADDPLQRISATLASAAERGLGSRRKRSGRPTKFTPVVVARVLEAISKGATYELAAGYAGVSYDSFNRWMRDKSEFCEAVKRAEATAALGWLDKIQTAANDGNWQAAAWKLERRFPRDYGRTVQTQEHEGQIDISITKRATTVSEPGSSGHPRATG